MGDGCLVGWTSGTRARGPSMAYIIIIPHFFSFLSISCRQQCRLSEQIWTRRVDRENSTQAKTSKEKREMLDRWSCRAARRIGGRLGLTDSSLRRAKRLSRPPHETRRWGSMRVGDINPKRHIGGAWSHASDLLMMMSWGCSLDPPASFFPGKGGKPRTKGQE